MKKRITIFMCSILIISLFASNFSAYAASVTINETFEEAISSMENEVSSSGSSVISELNELIAMYKEKQSSSSTEDYEKLQVLIDTTYELIEEYRAYQSGISTYGGFDLVSTPAVAAVIAYFKSQNYLLSAELLTYAKNNNELYSSYTPLYGVYIVESPVTKNIAKGTVVEGTAEYPNSGNWYQKDLYYAIHAFRYTKPS